MEEHQGSTVRTSVVTVMLERCAQAVEQVIMPNLTDTFALEQAMYTALLLRFLAPSVEEKSQELWEENKGMSEVISKILDALRNQETLSGNAVRDSLIEKLDRTLKETKVEPPDISEDNYNLKGVLVEIINGLDVLTEELPKETMSSLKQQIRCVLRQQLNHRLARVEALAAARAAAGILPAGFTADDSC